MEKQKPYLPDRLRDPKLPAVHASFAPSMAEQQMLLTEQPPSVPAQEQENRKLEQL